MKQSDILSFAINGVQMELKHKGDALDKLNEDINILYSNLKELQEMDRCQANEEPAVGRPAGFVAEPVLKSEKL